MRALPTTFPISSRRTGASAVQPMPLTKLASAKCHTARYPVHASTASTPDVTTLLATMATSAVRASTRSARAPMTAPKRAIGTIRNMPTVATRSADWVAW